MKMFSVVTMFRSIPKAFYVMAEAFKYGASIHGEGSWKDKSAEQHVDYAINDIESWMVTGKYSLLADAALRVIFALCLTATSSKYTAKGQV